MELIIESIVEALCDKTAGKVVAILDKAGEVIEIEETVVELIVEAILEAAAEEADEVFEIEEAFVESIVEAILGAAEGAEAILKAA